LNNGKGFDTLLKAFRIAAGKYTDSRLLIMGDGPERSNLTALAERLGLKGRVEFYGAYVRKEFAEALGESDAFVLASRGETFGVVCIEALACGLPVVATRCGGPEDFVNEANGLLVPVDDAEAFAKAMLEIRENIGSYDSAAISRFARETFSARAVAEKLTAVLKG